MPITTKKKCYQDTGNAVTARISLEVALSSHMVRLSRYITYKMIFTTFPKKF